MSGRALTNGRADHRAGSRGALAIGNKAIYPGQGPCRVGELVKRVVNDTVMMFYHLTVLDDYRGDLFVPVEKARAIGVRLLMKRSEIPALLDHLKKRVKTSDNWKQRAADNWKRFNSGSPYDLAEVVVSLTELSRTKSLTFEESGALDKAKRLLVCEISEVTRDSRADVEEQVESALKSQRKK
jgi:RNA polymerase-interacting CarD/CdnL/TRCF family regulator